MDDIVFRVSAGEVGFICVLLLVTGCLVFFAHRPFESWFRKGALITKISAIFLIGFLLLRPEIKKEMPNERLPSLLVLKDDSRSMMTKDLVAGADQISRQDALTRFLGSEAWNTFKADTSFEIRESSFSSGGDGTNLSEALATVRGESTVLVLSDGAWNTGETPANEAQRLRADDVPVFSVVFGKEEALPDLAVLEVGAPTLVETAEPFLIKAEVKSTYRETINSRVLLLDGADVVEQRSVTFGPEERKSVTFKSQINEVGLRKFSVKLEADPREATLVNNFKEVSVTAREQRIKVLLVDSIPRWEYRFIRNAMSRDPKVDVSCLLLHPDLEPGAGPDYISEFPTKNDLSAYDVIFIGDIGVGEKQLTHIQARDIISAVRENASGLILMPGRRGAQQTLLELPEFSSLYPVSFDDSLSGVVHKNPAKLTLSSVGRSSLLLSLTNNEDDNDKLWSALPGFNWYQPATRAKAGASTLAYHSNARNDYGQIPIIVTAKSGRGKVLYMGIDSSWRWRRGVEDLYHYRFWRQVASWMAYQRNLTDGDQVKLFLSNDIPNVGDSVQFQLQAMTEARRPAKGESVKLLLRSPSSKIKDVPLVTDEEWGTFSGKVTLEEPGAYYLDIEVEGRSVATRELTATEKNKEVEGELADYDSLNEVARITQGQSFRYDRSNEVFKYLKAAAKLPVRFEFLSLINQWIWYVIILAFLTLSWFLRRKGE